MPTVAQIDQELCSGCLVELLVSSLHGSYASSPRLPWGSRFVYQNQSLPLVALPHLSAPLSCEPPTEAGLRERALQTQPMAKVVCSRLCLPCLS